MGPLSRARAAFSVAGVVAAGLMLAPAASLAQPAEAEPWVLPRTADGQPDLQGVWSNNSATPLERPESLGDQAVLTDEELARAKARYAELFAEGAGDAAFADRVFTTALGDQDAFSYGDGSPGNYKPVLVGRPRVRSSHVAGGGPTDRPAPTTDPLGTSGCRRACGTVGTTSCFVLHRQATQRALYFCRHAEPVPPATTPTTRSCRPPTMWCSSTR